MTVATTDHSIVYVSNGSGQYNFGFEVTDSSTLKVYDGTALYTGAVTVTLNGDQENFPGGVVNIFPKITIGNTITILREYPLTQGTDYVPGGNFPSTAHEGALDKLTYLLQQLKTVIDRAITAPLFEAVSLVLPDVLGRKDKYLSFDSSGNIAMADLSGSSPIILAYPWDTSLSVVEFGLDSAIATGPYPDFINPSSSIKPSSIYCYNCYYDVNGNWVTMKQGYAKIVITQDRRVHTFGIGTNLGVGVIFVPVLLRVDVFSGTDTSSENSSTSTFYGLVSTTGGFTATKGVNGDTVDAISDMRLNGRDVQITAHHRRILTTTMSVSSAVNTTVILPTDQINFSAFYDISNDDKIILLQDGHYVITAGVQWSAGNVSSGQRDVWINTNAFPTAARDTIVIDSTASTGPVYQTLSTGPLSLITGDMISLACRQTSGGGLNLGGLGTFLSITKV